MEVIDVIGGKIVLKGKNSGSYIFEDISGRSFMISTNVNGEGILSIGNWKIENMTPEQLFKFIKGKMYPESFLTKIANSRITYYFILGSAGISLFIYGFQKIQDSKELTEEEEKELKKPKVLSEDEAIKYATKYCAMRTSHYGKKILNGLTYTAPVWAILGISYMWSKKN